jgi:hypothetical protein
MSSAGTQPEYGVKTCGKRAETPFDMLGPCLLEPGHEDRCEFQAPGLPDGRIRVSKVEQLPGHPWFSDGEVLKHRRMARKLFWGSMAAFAFNVAVSVWQVLGLLKILP